MTRPKLKQKIDLTNVINAVEMYFDYLEDKTEIDDVELYETEIFELIMISLYGKESIDFLNERIETKWYDN